MITYRDNYPFNIEAAQRVYVQYSQDIEFDYSTGKYPLGELYEGFIWESVYVPVPHQYGELELGRHVWMRWRIGAKDAWTLPMRITDSFSNIEATELEEIVGTERVKFRFKYTLDSGEIIYSEYMELTNGVDGVGIADAEIRGENLWLIYTNGTEENVGRVVGYDGVGFPSAGYDIPGNIPYVNPGGDVVWMAFSDILDLNLSGTAPIAYTNGVISHLNTDGYRHIPTGGASGNLLATDGAGIYSWYDIATALDLRIPWTDLDDTAGTGDTNKLYSADKILALVNAATVGIKYSVSLYSDLATIPSPLTGELAVVTADPLYPNRPVYRYNGATWDHFFDLDGAHNHDDRYYTKTELNTSGAGGAVHWDNVTNKSIFENWTIAGDIGSTVISDGETLSIIGSGGVSTSLSGNTLSISATGIYTKGGGIDIIGNVISHENTSSVGNTSNLNGVVLQNMTFDTYGHVLSRSSVNLDGRYSLLSHGHQNLTPGNGINGSSYNGSVARTWDLYYYGTGGKDGVSNAVARGDHYHANSATLNYTVAGGGIASWEWSAVSFMDMIKLSNGMVVLWGYLYKSGTNSAVSGIAISTYNPYPPSGGSLVSLPVTFIGAGGTQIHGTIDVSNTGIITARGPLTNGYYTRFSIMYYSGI